MSLSVVEVDLKSCGNDRGEASELEAKGQGTSERDSLGNGLDGVLIECVWANK